jgi:hypothetical protein
MSFSSANPTSVRLVGKALSIYAREIGEDPSDTETVMTDFLLSLMAYAQVKSLDFDSLVEAARAQDNGSF